VTTRTFLACSLLWGCARARGANLLSRRLSSRLDCLEAEQFLQAAKYLLERIKELPIRCQDRTERFGVRKLQVQMQNFQSDELFHVIEKWIAQSCLGVKGIGRRERVRETREKATTKVRTHEKFKKFRKKVDEVKRSGPRSGSGVQQN
jgi:hypothetical protein